MKITLGEKKYIHEFAQLFKQLLDVSPWTRRSCYYQSDLDCVGHVLGPSVSREGNLNSCSLQPQLKSTITSQENGEHILYAESNQRDTRNDVLKFDMQCCHTYISHT